MAELIEGVKIMMGTREWIVPPLSFKQAKRLLPPMSKIASGGVRTENMEDMATVVHAALSRNYPDVTLDQVEDILDLRNARVAMLAVMGQSGPAV